MKINGIEGPDLYYQFDLLGIEYSVSETPDYYFFPLNDHYNSHDQNWMEQTTAKAKLCPVVVFYDLVNTGDWEHPQFCKFIKDFDHPQKVYLTVNYSKSLHIPGVEIIAWDFMWNRIKSYYTETNMPNGLHHYSGKYSLEGINFKTQKEKKFLNLCGREYGFRTELFDLLKNNSHGFVSNRSKGIYLDEQEPIGAYVPVPDYYYNETYFSIYVESNCTSTDLIHITEKTFEPLIKGHFVIPFSNPGSVARLQNMGFEVPGIIDYGYDSIQDPGVRFNMIMIEFKNLMNINLAEAYRQYLPMFKHNQNCLVTIPYDNSIKRLENV